MHRDMMRATLLPASKSPTLLEVARGQRRLITERAPGADNAEAGFDAHLDAETEKLRRMRGFDPETGDPHYTPRICGTWS